MSIRVKLIIICQTLSILYALPQYSQQLSEVGIIIYSILQMRKLKSKWLICPKNAVEMGGSWAPEHTFLPSY